MKSLKKIIFLFLTFCFVTTYSQNIGINSTGATPNSSAMLDIDVSGLAAKKGLLIPRITAAQKTAMNPLPVAAQGLLIYQTDGAEGFYYNTSTTATPTWSFLLPNNGANGGWGLSGNAGTIDGTNFIGTTDNVALNFRVNNQSAGKIDKSKRNVFFGILSGVNTTGQENVLIGDSAGYSNTTGNSNIFIGSRAGRSNTSTFGNIYIGSNCGQKSTGQHNTYVGSSAGFNNVSGIYNTFFGQGAGVSSTGSYNTLVGYRAGANAGAYEVMIGYEAGSSATSNGLFIGARAGEFNSGGGNVFFGFESGRYNSGSFNTFIGGGNRHKTGGSNVFIGLTAARFDTAGYNNTIIGDAAGLTQTAGHNNTYLGTGAGKSGEDAFENVAIGADAGAIIGSLVKKYHSNVYVGHRSAWGLIGSNNTLLGDSTACSGLVYCDKITLLGAKSSASTGVLNSTAIGYGAIVTASNSIVLGTSAEKIGMGTSAPINKVDVEGAMVIGSAYSGTNSAPTNGLLVQGNTGIGTTSPNAKFEVYNNSGAGISEMIVNSNGTTDADFILKTTNSNMGWFGGGTVNKLAAWNYANNTEPLTILGSNGNVGIGVTAPTQKLHVSGNGLFTGTVTASCGVLACSDVRYKKNINPLANSLRKILLVNGVTYNFKQDEFPEKNFSNKNQIGFIAQDLEIIFPELVETDDKGYKTVDYSKITPVLVEAIKEQQKTIEDNKKKIIEMNQLIEQMNTRLNAIENSSSLTAEAKK